MGKKRCSEGLTIDQVEAIDIAIELRYGEEIIEKIKRAKTGAEVSRIMAQARTDQYD